MTLPPTPHPPPLQQAEVASPTDSEDRTPGRLQAVWPPPKPKDEDEKVGLKYTEAGEKLCRGQQSNMGKTLHQNHSPIASLLSARERGGGATSVTPGTSTRVFSNNTKQIAQR